MSTHSVLHEEDWSDYDNRKIRGGSDRNDFACTESWEVDYLVKKIHNQHPDISTDQIRAAIKACCAQLRAPHPRAAFVTCVMKRLGLS